MKFVSIALFILVVLNVGLLSFVSTGAKLPLKQGDVPDLELIEGKRFSGEKAATLYVFYNADEKCSCLEDWVNWVKVHEDYDSLVEVKGIFNGVDLEKFRQFNRGFDIPFSTYIDNGSKLRNKFRLPPNVLSKVLVDANGFVLISDVYEDNPRDQYFFLKRVQMHCDRILEMM